MPVEKPDLEAAAERYADALRDVAGSPPPRLDLVHLGLGGDGHTASLLPGSPLMAPDGPLVGTTAPYKGWRRMTLALPALSHARNVLWFVSGSSKDAVVPAAGPEEVSRRYLDGSLVLETTFDAPGGRLRLTDALAVGGGERAHDLGQGSPHVCCDMQRASRGRWRWTSCSTRVPSTGGHGHCWHSPSPVW